MGWKHVEPQFILRAMDCLDSGDNAFPIQGDGSDTRSFCYVDDCVEGILAMYEKGGHREIYHIGSDEEMSIRELALRIGKIVGVDLDIRPGPSPAGGTRRRCPDITKMRALGWSLGVSVDEGLERTVEWYRANRNLVPANDLM
jgi:UDP-glucose 4-epimerase